MKTKDVIITALFIIVPAAVVAWIRTLVDADETFPDNFFTFTVLAVIVYIGGALAAGRKKGKR